MRRVAGPEAIAFGLARMIGDMKPTFPLATKIIPAASAPAARGTVGFAKRSIQWMAGICLLWCAAASAQSQPRAVDPSTMNGKVMCGYQGWFNTPSDGSGRNWVHWGRRPLGDGDWTVDMLPDVGEFDADELCDTDTRAADGLPVRVFSSYNPKTVARHFKWMQAYGIDGVFLQRFASGVNDPGTMKHYDRIVANVRSGAETYGRVWGMMYDLSGLKAGDAPKVIDDWKRLAGQDGITKDKQYIRHLGKPVIALWGIGFGDGTPAARPDLFEDGLRLVQFLKSDPTFGGNTVMIGIPHQWRDRLKKMPPAEAAAFQKVLLAADILQPWAVGSCRNPEEAIANAKNKWAPDLVWCREHGKVFMPVVFPGFTWHNLMDTRQEKSESDAIPRLGGRFLWTQYVEARKLNVSTVYQAMFDEVDEGTAIFKLTDRLPAPGKSVFVGTHGLPSDFYLKLVGQATRLIRREITPQQETLIEKMR